MQKKFPQDIKLSLLNSKKIVAITPFAQIAYAMRPMIVGALGLASESTDENHAKIAGELATWFFGNNPAGIAMYDPATGRCFDGILSANEINKNSGAESTIEALYALLNIEANHTARKVVLDWIDKQAVEK